MKNENHYFKSRYLPLDHADPEGLVCQLHPAKDSSNSFNTQCITVNCESGAER